MIHVPLLIRWLGHLAVLGIIVLSLLPGSIRPSTGAGGFFEHVIAYAGTAALLCTGYGPRGRLHALASLILLALCLELMQAWVPGRVSAPRDALAGAFGACLGWLSSFPALLVLRRLV